MGVADRMAGLKHKPLIACSFYFKSLYHKNIYLFNKEMAPISGVTPLSSSTGQQLLSTTSHQARYFIQNYQQNSNLPSHLSGPAAVLIFMNTFNMAFNFKLGQYPPNSPEIVDLMGKVNRGVQLKLTMNDIVNPNMITGDLSMSKVAKIAENTKLLNERIWYTQTQLDK
eukprot:TCONS_00024852-protein